MPADIPGFGGMGGAARREDAMRLTLAAHKDFHVPADPLSPRSTFARGMDLERRSAEEDAEAGQDDVRTELGLRSLLDSLESSLSNEEEGLRKMPGFGFPAATELPPRNIEYSSSANVWHPTHALHTEGGV